MVGMLTAAMLLVLTAGSTAKQAALADLANVTDVVITGRVTNAGTGSPIVGAIVAVAGTSWAVVTRADGEYRLVVSAEALPAGKTRISLRGNG